MKATWKNNKVDEKCKTTTQNFVVEDSQISCRNKCSLDDIPGTCTDQISFDNWSDCSCKSDKWHDDLPLGQKPVHFEKDLDSKLTRDMGTMTDHILVKDVELENKCNEYFGRMVACEISNIEREVRYDKMKEIIGLFQKLNK